MNDQSLATDTTDAADQLRRWTSLMGRAQQLMLEFWTREGARSPIVPAADPNAIVEAWATTARAVLADPGKVAEIQANYWADTIKLWQSFATGEGNSPVAELAEKDKRFKGEAWREQPAFDLLRQCYLLTSQYLLETAAGLEGIDGANRQKMLFYTRQFIDAMSPSNFLFTNPEALGATAETRGENLLKGLEHMLADLSRGRMTMTDETAFEVGRNIAATPGKVVFENRLFQLIQYAPVTEQVYETPLLIMPPWINKYYILDLTPEKSFIRWAVEQGLTVFVVSWRNPGPEFAGATIDTYIAEGYLEALDRVCEITGERRIHMIGYCVAGTTLAATMAYLATKGEGDRIKTATFFTAQVDFEDAGELKVFIDDPQLQSIEELTRETGYLDGRYMATTFNLLRSNDLIWNYVVNNYMLGKEYFPFDLLYWNSDATNVPASWHAAYLRDFYRDNRLARPGGVTVLGQPIDINGLETPIYVQAGKEDHIAPARSVYKIKNHFKGPIRFVLAGSGHIAGVVNPPSARKYQYWTNDELPETLEAFQAGAVETKGSWWPDWLAWVAPQSGAKVPAREPGAGPLPAIEDAPGRYVKERI